ncbi:DUF4270 family protein [Siphonobacter curvatus]|uniref:DUF4270 domain-containing protein n=1 Tax=Siphonobacter curvatus TaxID=2094562 RepID=A0A2S7IMI2_9BACT|nr:DUF4270 family protein [Siphonobacter curvatus]PQA58856.1 hypothetical protein C5O19_04135 [Siphonobacter curvatus]
MKNWKTWLSLGFIASGLYSLGGCQKGDLTLGSEIIPNENLSVVMIDTFTVKLSTVAVSDSAITSADSSMYVGRWKDENTGMQEFTAFMSPSYPSNTLNTRLGARYDSLVLVLPLSLSYGDSVQTFKISTHQTTTPLVQSITYYNTNTSVQYQVKPLAQASFAPGRGTTPSVRQRFSDTLGVQLFNALQNNTINNNETLHNLLPGFAVKGSSKGNVIVGLSVPRSFLRVYFHDDNLLTPTAESVDIPFTFMHYSRYASDFTGTPLANLKQQPDVVNSTLTDNKAYITQSGPLRTRVEFPYLTETLEPYLTLLGVNRAELVFDPVRTDVRDNTNPPSTLVLYKTNAVNDILTNQPVENVQGTGAVVSATYVVDNSGWQLKDHYTFNVTNYFNLILKRKVQNAPLILTPPVGAQQYLNFSRTALGNRDYPSDRVRLRLYFTQSN